MGTMMDRFVCCHKYVCPNLSCKDKHNEQCAETDESDTDNKNKSQQSNPKVRRLSVSNSQETHKRKKQKHSRVEKRKIKQLKEELFQKLLTEEKKAQIKQITNKIENMPKLENKEEIAKFIADGYNLALSLQKCSDLTQLTLVNTALKAGWQSLQNALNTVKTILNRKYALLFTILG